MGPERKLYVPCEGSDFLLELGGEDGPVAERHRVGPGAVAAAHHQETGRTLVLTRTGELLLYDREDRAVTKRMRTTGRPLALELELALSTRELRERRPAPHDRHASILDRISA